MTNEAQPGAGSGSPGPPSRPAHPTAWGEIRDAVSLRSLALVTGTLLLGIGFVLSYVGALHAPRLHALPVTIVAPTEQQAQRVAAKLAQLPGDPIAPTPGTDRAAAAEQVANRDTGAAFVINPSGTRDTLIVASAAGAAQAVALEGLFSKVGREQGRLVTVDDVVPVGGADFNGLSAFYLVVGWCVTGYLVAAILGISAGARPSNLTRGAIRFAVLGLCAFAASLVGTWLIRQHILGALHGAYWPLVGLGTLLVFAVGALTTALLIAFGPIGIGLAVLLVVVLGNPSAGGPFPREMLPPFWRAIGAFLPPGAGTDVVRSISYFGSTDITDPLLILGGYALLGLLLSVALCMLKREPRPTRPDGPSGPGAAPNGQPTPTS